MPAFEWMRAKFLRATMFALFLCLIPASSRAGVFVSVGFAPPILPVYVQPPCPEPGWMWTPGYWAYGPDGYYWVPGTWVPAPYEGALWTPPYWGWSGGLFVFHPGYWGAHVGYYGGVNYGFGYMGIGFVGGAWHGHEFAYNTAVVHVNTTIIHNTYVDNTVVRNNTIVNNNHVSYNGGPGGINHQPTPQENSFAHEQHMAPTSFQTQHESTARSNVNAYASHNGGHPQNLAMSRPAVGGNAHPEGTINYNASKSNTGNVTAPRGQNQNPNQHGSINYNSSKSNSGNAPVHPQNQGFQPQSHPQNQGHQPPQSHQPPPPQSHESHQPPPRNDQHGHR